MAGLGSYKRGKGRPSASSNTTLSPPHPGGQQIVQPLWTKKLSHSMSIMGFRVLSTFLCLRFDSRLQIPQGVGEAPAQFRLFSRMTDHVAGNHYIHRSWVGPKMVH